MRTSTAKTLTDQPVLLREDRADGVSTLTLNRPAARNSLSSDLISAIQTALDDMRDDPAVKVVILAGSGTAFCAGHDLTEIRAKPGREAFETLFGACSAMMMSILKLPKPVIAKVHGPASAAGCQIVATCDLAVASTAAGFATPGVNIGLFCSTPMVALSRNVARKHAMEMLLSGEMVDAETAVRIGLVNRAVAPEALDETVDQLARTIAGKSPLTLAIGKEAFYRQLELGIEEAYAYTGEVMVRNMLARDAEEGIDAFLERRPPQWEGR